MKSRKAIDALFAKGKQFSAFPLRVWWDVSAGEPILQAGFSVSAKTFKKATDRNRIKRLVRESYRRQKNQLQDAVISGELRFHLFFIYVGKEVPRFESLFEQMNTALLRLNKIINENAE